MKKIIFVLLLLIIAISLFSQNQEKKVSRLHNLDSIYKLTAKDEKFIDSVLNVIISPAKANLRVLKKTLIKDSLYIYQEVFPVSANIIKDSLGGYNEVIDFRAITTIISEKHEPGSYHNYFQNLKKLKAEAAARLREQAKSIEQDE